jgi:hypothetical protein
MVGRQINLDCEGKFEALETMRQREVVEIGLPKKSDTSGY